MHEAVKVGFRIPSVRKRIAARTSYKRYLRHSVGLKAPRGWGWLTNPRKAAYNRIYRRTTIGIEDLFRIGRRRNSSADMLALLAIAALLWPLALVFLIIAAASELLRAFKTSPPHTWLSSGRWEEIQQHVRDEAGKLEERTKEEQQAATPLPALSPPPVLASASPEPSPPSDTCPRCARPLSVTPNVLALCCPHCKHALARCSNPHCRTFVLAQEACSVCKQPAHRPPIETSPGPNLPAIAAALEKVGIDPASAAGTGTDLSNWTPPARTVTFGRLPTQSAIAGTTYVRGHIRKSGAYVAPHTRRVSRFRVRRRFW